MKDWIKQQRPLSREEQDHLLDGTDFVALVEKQEECWLDKIVERALSKFPLSDVKSSPVPAICGLSNRARASSLRRSTVV